MNNATCTSCFDRPWPNRDKEAHTEHVADDLRDDLRDDNVIHRCPSIRDGCEGEAPQIRDWKWQKPKICPRADASARQGLNIDLCLWVAGVRALLGVRQEISRHYSNKYIDTADNTRM